MKIKIIEEPVDTSSAESQTKGTETQVFKVEPVYSDEEIETIERVEPEINEPITAIIDQVLADKRRPVGRPRRKRKSVTEIRHDATCEIQARDLAPETSLLTTSYNNLRDYSGRGQTDIIAPTFTPSILFFTSMETKKLARPLKF